MTIYYWLWLLTIPVKVTRGHDKKRSDSAVSMLPRGLTQRYQWHRRESDSRGPLHGTNLLKNTENILAPCCHWYSKVWLRGVWLNSVNVTAKFSAHVIISAHVNISAHVIISAHVNISAHVHISAHVNISEHVKYLGKIETVYEKTCFREDNSFKF